MREGWEVRAACRSYPADIWFTDVALAVAVCRDECPVREQCLGLAMRHEQRSAGRFGVWGGLTANQRAALYRRERAARSSGDPPEDEAA